MEQLDSCKGLTCNSPMRDTQVLTLGSAHGFSASKLTDTQVLAVKQLMAPLTARPCVCIHVNHQNSNPPASAGKDCTPVRKS